ncbi:MAG TPA: hypothetical protein VIG25_13980 [Pyrinomonadaceae bacterium]|jgi:hypothetical protein
MDILKVLIPATIALIGTIITLVFGYRQWKRQQEVSRSSTYVTEKQSAYKELWRKLEDVHIKLRTDEVSEPEFRKLVLDVNSYILRNSLYLDDYDREMSNNYLRAVRRMKQLVSESGDEETQAALTSSEVIPDRVSADAKELGRSVREVEQLRGALIERFRKIVGAG